MTGSFSWFLDEARGVHAHWHTYNTWQDIQGAVNAADQFAQSHHLHHVYIYADQYTDEALTYLAGQMKTPVTVVSRSHCLVLPVPSSEPVVALVGPADPLNGSLLKQFGSAKLLGQPPRLSGTPFQIYSVQPSTSAPDEHSVFGQVLMGDKKRPGTLIWKNPNRPTQPAVHLFETLWTSLQAWPASYRTVYTYKFVAHYAGNGTDGQTAETECSFSQLEPGERLFIPFELPDESVAWPTSLTLDGSLWKSQPYIFHWGPLRFGSILDQHTFQSSLGTHFLVKR